ncbi:unnamed protein product [Psylliodes chrysocephalus]|uniref:Uncharacterized protein n=1 Tax=Psylliodes chrysocephalus TaxID=3402493 RepID=A0A9P0CRA0_9CUCU|nr:unnamed protein product [Psylliodes chrysocephala]
MPNETNKIMKFKNFKNKEPVPLVIYSNIERELKDYDDDDTQTSNTQIYRKHKAFSVAYYLKSHFENRYRLKFRFYIGRDCLDWFVDELQQSAKYFKKFIIPNPELMNLTLEEENNFLMSTTCYVCHKPFLDVDTKSETYELNALHYYTTLGFAFDDMLKISNVELELLTDNNISLFIKKSIREGASQCSNRYAECKQQYVNTRIFLRLIYVILDHFNLHKDLPFCPEHLVPPTSDSDQPKLLSTLYDKEKYVIHYLAIQLGIVVRKIHRCLKFK